MMATMDLAEFLLARIAEDERTAEVSGDPIAIGLEVHRDELYGPMLIVSTLRVLAECEAKRRIVAAYIDERSRRDIYESDEGRAAEADETVDPALRERQVIARRSSAARCRGLEIAVEALTLPYADHPDYREEWRP